MFDWIREWLQRQQRHDERLTFQLDAAQIKAFRETVEEENCPSCDQKKLEVDVFSYGAKGWGAIIHCTNCDFKGEINTLGFNMRNITKRKSS